VIESKRKRKLKMQITHKIKCT